MKRLMIIVCNAIIILLAFNCKNVFAETREVTIGTANTSQYAPFNNNYKNSWNEAIYTSSEVGAAGLITSVSWYCTATTSLTFSSMKIYMGAPTDAVIDGVTDWSAASNLTEVYSGTNVALGNVTGWKTFTLTTPYMYDGTSDLVIVVSKKCSSPSSLQTWRYTQIAENRCMYRQSDTDATYASHPGSNSGQRTNNRPNVKLTLEPGVCVGDSYTLDNNYTWYTDQACTHQVSNNTIQATAVGDVTYYRKETQVSTFSYTGSSSTYTVPTGATSLKMEVWGAQGGSYSTTYSGGKGGYSVGTLSSPTAGSSLYVVVGGQPTAYTTTPSSSVNTTISGGYNGGGSAVVHYYASNSNKGWALPQGGGGATHIASAAPGSGSDYQLQYYSTNSGDILLAAGGGSGGVYCYGTGTVGLSGYTGFSGYAGGGTTSYAYAEAYKASQTTAGTNGAFGKGASVTGGYNYRFGVAGAGGGYNGGGCANNANNAGYSDTYSQAVVRSNGGGSGYVKSTLASASTKDGNTSFASTSGGTETGHSGDGYAKITANIIVSYKVTVVQCCTPVDAPTTFRQVSGSNVYQGVKLEWSPVDGATSYNIEYGTTTSYGSTASEVNGTSVSGMLQYTISNLTPAGTTYYFRITPNGDTDEDYCETGGSATTSASSGMRSASISGQTIICEGSSSTLTCTPTGFTTARYSWSASPSGTSAGLPTTLTTASIIVSPTTTTTYTCAVTENGESSAGASPTFVVTVVPKPDIDMPDDFTVCVGDAINIGPEVGDLDCGSATYAWSGSYTGSGSYTSDAALAISPTAAGSSMTFTLTVTNSQLLQYDLFQQNGVWAIVVTPPTQTAQGKAVPIYTTGIGSNTANGTQGVDVAINRAINVNGGAKIESGTRQCFAIPSGVTGGVCQSSASVTVTVNPNVSQVTITSVENCDRKVVITFATSGSYTVYYGIGNNIASMASVSVTGTSATLYDLTNDRTYNIIVIPTSQTGGAFCGNPTSTTGKPECVDCN